MSAVITLKQAATALQALTVAGFVVLLCYEHARLTGLKDWVVALCLYVPPILVQVFICRFLCHPIIYVSSIIISLLILVLIANDLSTRGYFLGSMLLALPITVTVLFIGTVIFLLLKGGANSSKPPRGAYPHSRSGDGQPVQRSDGPPAV